MKKIELFGIYNILLSVQPVKMDPEDKSTIIKIMCEISPVALQVSKALEIAREKLKGENHDELLEKRHDWSNLSDEDKKTVQSYFAKYEKDIEDSIKDILEENYELTVKLSEKGYTGLIASKDFDIATMMQLKKLIV